MGQSITSILGGNMSMQLVREAYELDLLDYTIEIALKVIGEGAEETDLAELYSICSSVMFKKIQR